MGWPFDRRCVAADNPLMTQPLLDGVLPMALGWPTTECCRRPPDDPWLLQSDVAIGFELALPRSNGVLPMVQGWPFARRRRWPLDGPELFHNSDTDSIEMANETDAADDPLMAHSRPKAAGQSLRVGPAPLKWGASDVTGLATRLTLPLIWVGHLTDAADNPLMTQPLLDGVLPMAPGLPTTERCRWLQWPTVATKRWRHWLSTWPCSSQMVCCQWYWFGHSPFAADGLLMAQNYFKAVLSMASGWPTTRCCR